MTVYLDNAGHLTADIDEELHAFARCLGLKREWFQDHRIHHYDVMSHTLRLLAWHQFGAQRITARQTVLLDRVRRLPEVE